MDLDWMEVGAAETAAETASRIAARVAGAGVGK
jgi:hypothetical protein